MNVQCTSMNVECTYGWAISSLGREIVYLCVCARVRVRVLVYICACVCVWRSFSFVLSVLSVWRILVVHSKINYIIFHWHHLELIYLFTHRWTGKGTNSCKCYTARMVSITIAALPALGMLAHRDIRLRSPVTEILDYEALSHPPMSHITPIDSILIEQPWHARAHIYLMKGSFLIHEWVVSHIRMRCMSQYNGWVNLLKRFYSSEKMQIFRSVHIVDILMYTYWFARAADADMHCAVHVWRDVFICRYM